MEVVIRNATLDDAPMLLDYAARLFSENLPGVWRRPVPTLEDERGFIASYATPNSTLLVAEHAGEPVGLAGLLGRSLEQESHVGSVGISVDREWRGRGVGTRLLEHVIAWAPEHGITRIEIEAFATNPRAIALYERLGFVREGVRKGAAAVEGEYIDIILLARQPVAEQPHRAGRHEVEST